MGAHSINGSLENCTPISTVPCQMSTDAGSTAAQPDADAQRSIAPTNRATPKVAILLCTCNGERYLEEQFDSIFRQTYSKLEIHAADDCSQDATIGILNKLKQHDSRLSTIIQNQARKGFAANFLSLVCNPAIEADFYAYSDQDDIWEADKIKRALAWLETIPAETPALYCSRTQLVSPENQTIGFSPLFKKTPAFANALVQNIGGGNTMVFNHAARKLLMLAGQDVAVVAHDWWTYLVVSGCGGRVFYDSYPSVRYRQHGHNLIGMNIGMQARFRRIRMLFEGRLKIWTDTNIKALEKLHNQLTDENRAVLNRFIDARNCSLAPRLLRFQQSGIYRQTLPGNLGLIAAAVFNRI